MPFLYRTMYMIKWLKCLGTKKTYYHLQLDNRHQDEDYNNTEEIKN